MNKKVVLEGGSKKGLSEKQSVGRGRGRKMRKTEALKCMCAAEHLLKEVFPHLHLKDDSYGPGACFVHLSLGFLKQGIDEVKSVKRLS